MNHFYDMYVNNIIHRHLLFLLFLSLLFLFSSYSTPFHPLLLVLLLHICEVIFMRGVKPKRTCLDNVDLEMVPVNHQVPPALVCK